MWWLLVERAVAVWWLLRCGGCCGVVVVAMWWLLRCGGCCGVVVVAVWWLLRCGGCGGVVVVGKNMVHVLPGISVEVFLKLSKKWTKIATWKSDEELRIILIPSLVSNT